MIKKMQIIFIGLSLICLAGCSDPQAVIHRMVPPETDQLVQKFIQVLNDNKLDEMAKFATPELSQAPEAEIQKVRQSMALGNLISQKIVGYNRVTTAGVAEAKDTRESITYELEYEKGWMVAGVFVIGNDGQKKVTGFHVKQMPESIEKINALKFSGVSLSHYIYLALAVLSAVVLVAALIMCSFSKMNRKWLWILAILFGNISTKYNWTEGKLLLLEKISLGFNFGLFRSGLYGPWMLDVMLPIGAIVFLVIRNQKGR